MAMILDAFVSRYVGKLAEFVEGEACKVLGVKEEIRKLQRWLATIRDFLQDAEHRRHKDAATDNWVRELKDVMYDADDIIDLCMFEGGKLLEARPSASGVRFPFSLLSSCFKCLKFRHEISRRIKALNDRLKEIAENKSITSKLEHTEQGPKDYRVISRETSPLEITADIVGIPIEDASQNLISSILKNDKKKCEVFGIVGMGGIGKTTLARKIFNDQRIKDNFSICIWLCVSKNYTETELLKEMIRGAGGYVDGAKSRAELETKLVSLLSRNFFLVLDDVWSENVWEDLLRCSIENATVSSKTLITTRDERVARNIGTNDTHHVEKMDINTGWELLCKKVFKEGEEDKILELREIGIEIVGKCDGLPLAIKVMGGVLRCREQSRTEWEQLLRSELWRMKQTEGELPRALYLSYEDLPSHLKQCFLYCALYASKIRSHEDLVRLWVAEGFLVEQGDTLMEEVGEDYFNELISRNLLQLDPGYLEHSLYTVHDHLVALAAHLMGEEGISIKDGQPLNKKNPFTKIRRLSVLNVGERLTLPREIMEQKCLRTLILSRSPQTKTIFEDDVIETLGHLRVLDICDTWIEILPKSLGKLLHLRYLDLDRTNISEIPESIGNLANLQTLNVSGCINLHRLPNSLTRLCNLRCLRADETPLTHVPKGIGMLRNINCLTGFVVGHDTSSTSNSDQGCSLNELQSLYQLRYLKIDNLERAEPGVSALANKSLLRELRFNWMPSGDGHDDGAPWTEEQIQRAETICNELSPPSSLQDLHITHFPGRRFPGWMMSTSLGASFPDLAYLELRDILSCTELPPLRMLPRLKLLVVEGAKAIKTIGPEFLGRSAKGTPAFPKLQRMKFINMPNWEEWSTCTTQLGVADGADIKLLPNLEELVLEDCTKLRALPEGLRHATKLDTLYLDNTRSLREIKNLPFSTQLYIGDSPGMERISDLPSLRRLLINDCASLKHVEKLDSLQHVVLTCPPPTEQLPQWFLGLFEKLQSAPSAQRRFKKFEIYCGLPLLKSCLKGGVHWPIIQLIPEVRIVTNNGVKHSFRIASIH